MSNAKDQKKKPQGFRPKRRKKGFEMTSGLLQARIREATETRGFSEMRLLTHWSEIVGTQTAAMARPVKVTYAKGGFGATLVLLTTGAFAPMLQAELPKIQNRVNAVYGYNAISRIHITQTAPTGFAEGRVQFEHNEKEKRPVPTPQVRQEANALAQGAQDENLRKALEKLASSFLSRSGETVKKVNL
ncbi:hypothetical protein EDD53_2595 [Pacificibacter maritimus]|uniref:Uncharacterized protein n=1 Tax=Pacificibacter maritimus TaxID=762213 RepID=A0A3N4UCD0_9RHOB|nr:DciA family protein [Pacificibacter maritimus]RPE64831.1 hypothetical protein EDD53_2595 [Pacificibacter maritimus]